MICDVSRQTADGFSKHFAFKTLPNYYIHMGTNYYFVTAEEQQCTCETELHKDEMEEKEEGCQCIRRKLNDENHIGKLSSWRAHREQEKCSFMWKKSADHQIDRLKTAEEGELCGFDERGEPMAVADFFSMLLSRCDAFTDNNRDFS